MLCRHCGNEIAEGTFFCASCGKNIYKANKDTDEISRLEHELYLANERMYETSELQTEAHSKRTARLAAVIAILGVACIVMGFGWLITSDTVKGYKSEIAGLKSYNDDLVMAYKVENDGLRSDIASLNAKDDGQLTAKNEELQNNVTKLTAQNKELQDNAQQLSAKNKELQDNMQQFSAKNKELQDDVQKLTAKNEELQGKVNDLQKTNNGLQSLNDNYNEKLSTLQSFADAAAPNGLYVKIGSVWNGTNEAEKISDDLTASDLEYLCFDYQAVSPSGLDTYIGKDIEIRLYENGALCQGKESPTTCTFTEEIMYGQLESGWGSSSGGSYEPGFCTIQIVYNNEVVGEKTVTIK